MATIPVPDPPIDAAARHRLTAPIWIVHRAADDTVRAAGQVRAAAVWAVRTHPLVGLTAAVTVTGGLLGYVFGFLTGAGV